MGLRKGVAPQAQKKFFLYKWLEDPLFESWLQPQQSNPLSFKCKLCGPNSTFTCATGKSHLESHAKMHGLGVENKENEFANRESVRITIFCIYGPNGNIRYTGLKSSEISQNSWSRSCGSPKYAHVTYQNV